MADVNSKYWPYWYVRCNISCAAVKSTSYPYISYFPIYMNWWCNQFLFCEQSIIMKKYTFILVEFAEKIYFRQKKYFKIACWLHFEKKKNCVSERICLNILLSVSVRIRKFSSTLNLKKNKLFHSLSLVLSSS